MTSLITPQGLLAFVNLYVPRPPAPNAEPRYSCVLIFDQEAQEDPRYMALKKAVMACLEDTFGAAKARDTKFLKSIRLPFRDAGEKVYAGFEKGRIYIQPWTKDKPGVVDRNKSDILVPGDVWAGQLARAAVRPFGYDTSGNKGVALNLAHVQIVNPSMPRLDGRKTAKDTFDDDLADDGVDDTDDEDIPF